ncbi:MAG: M28 family peptidase [Vicinamibacterales bacterium]
MRTRIALVLVLAVAGSSAQAGQTSLPDRVRAAADRITAAQISRDLNFLASDELKGRNTPSPGFDAAAKYIAERLRRAGLKPAGDNGTFFQYYTLREATADTEKSFIDAGGRRLRFGDDFVLRSFAGPLTGAFKAVYVGHGWTMPSRGIDPYAGLDVRGKILIAHGPRALPKDVEIAQIGRITPGASSVFTEAEKRGAAGIIFLPQASALTNWDAMRRQNTRMRELEPRVPSAYAAQPVTSVLLSGAAADAVLAGESNAADLMTKAEARDYPASFELSKPIALGIAAATSVAHRPYNVVAILEGSDPVLRTEYITVEAHLDGAVGSRTVEGDAIYNSADDNASGSAGTLSVAEQMVRVRPKRSIIFIWDSGEEQGLWGTRHFVANPPVPLSRIVAHFNIDMIGATRAPGSPDAADQRVAGPNEVFLIGPGVLSAKADAVIDRVNRGYLNMTFSRAFDRADSEFFYPRTDAGPFLERGILTIGFTTGIHARYHLPADEARFLDPEKIEAVARTVFASVWMLADSAERPSIDKPIPATVPRYGG